MLVDIKMTAWFNLWFMHRRHRRLDCPEGKSDSKTTPLSKYKEYVENLKEEILKLKEKRNAIILAHNYQRPEIQDISDILGDSITLSLAARDTEADIIVYCGVDVQADIAKILNPKKIVLLPDINAKCPMALMLHLEDLKRAKQQYPDSEVLLYTNTPTEMKAYGDRLTTSANIVEVASQMEKNEIIWASDIHMADYVAEKSGKKVIPVSEEVVCPVHNQLSLEDLVGAIEEHPNAEVLAHPECLPEIRKRAKYLASTEGILNYCKKSDAKEFIIATENGLLYRLRKEILDKKFYPASETAICTAMSSITLERLRDSLKDMKYQVEIPEQILYKARKAIGNSGW